MFIFVIIILIIIIYRLSSNSNSLTTAKPLTPEEEAKIDEILSQYRDEIGTVEYDEPELEESDIEGLYFNEFGEYVDEHGNVLTPSQVYNAKNRYDIWEDMEEDYQAWRKSRR